MGGLLACFADNGVDARSFDQMVPQMVHRGPDSSGVWYSDDHRTALGNTRLSVQDLTEAGKQPMQSRCGNFLIIHDGEIYNKVSLRRELEDRGHLFRSNSDAEVILYGYIEFGEDILEKLNGMYAFIDNKMTKHGFHQSSTFSRLSQAVCLKKLLLCF